jgi:hypothetical protein
VPDSLSLQPTAHSQQRHNTSSSSSNSSSSSGRFSLKLKHQPPAHCATYARCLGCLEMQVLLTKDINPLLISHLHTTTLSYRKWPGQHVVTADAVTEAPSCCCNCRHCVPRQLPLLPGQHTCRHSCSTNHAADICRIYGACMGCTLLNRAPLAHAIFRPVPHKVQSYCYRLHKLLPTAAVSHC